jgi:manganese/zinc/iron transport system substrate-binding protein
MIGDAVKHFVDSSCVVNTLMGPGVDPHLFKPTKSSLELLSRADIIVANGLHLEGKMLDVLNKMKSRTRVIILGEGVNKNLLIPVSEDSEQLFDPHIWFDLLLWKEALMYLRRELEMEPFYDNQSATAYLDSITGLHQWVENQVSQIPEERRVLITAHDAFEYFGKAYSVEVFGLQGISTAAEYGVRDVTNMVNLIQDRQIPAIFVESSVSTRSIQAVIEGCVQGGYDLQLGGTLYSDALGAEGSGADSYFGMVKQNVQTITNSLR